MATGSHAYAAYPSAVVYGQKVAGARKGKKPVQQVIWGDWIKVLKKEGDWRKVRARGEEGWMHKDDLQDDRLLEVNFVDVGQGDGCHVVTPKDKHLLIDAGESENMYRFLNWRFRGFKKKFVFDAVIISHPDKDHYKGFKKLFKKEKVHLKTVYHNGIVERVAAKTSDGLGARKKVPALKGTFLTDLKPDLAGLKTLLSSNAKVGKRRFPRLLRLAANSGRVDDIRMLSAGDGFMPGYEANKDPSIEVLGPVPEDLPGGGMGLRWFGSISKTKNGHSVVLRLTYGGVSVLLGGDLNIPAENHLLRHYTGLRQPPRSGAEEEETIMAARPSFECDVAKACHHGSSDFTDVFLRAVNPIATVISSGDDESYSHPRPDALGAFGKFGRGSRPLIFSTELARSSKDTIKNPVQFTAKLQELYTEFDKEDDPAKKDKIKKAIDTQLGKIERSITVYGMINLRSDGEKVIIAQKLERKRANGQRWDIHKLEPGPDGRLRYISKHG
jgi:beta-lactamase superfamily II metal-dependent hydrolase